MRASIAALRKRNPAKIVMAVPVAAAQTLSEMRDLVDDVVCIEAPTAMHAIGQWYEDFTQTSDEEVSQILDRAQHRRQKGGLSVEDAGHVPAERFDQRDHDGAVQQNLNPADDGHFGGPSEFSCRQQQAKQHNQER